MVAQVPGAHGRYILCQSERYSVKAVAEILAKRFPQYKFSSTKEGGPMPGFDTSKVRTSVCPSCLCAPTCCLCTRVAGGRPPSASRNWTVREQ